MGKTMDSLKNQLNTEFKDDAEKCIIVYNSIIGLHGNVWASNWQTLTRCRYINNKRIHALSDIGEIYFKGLNI